eukprot:4766502-Amphidinium_carterae.2
MHCSSWWASGMPSQTEEEEEHKATLCLHCELTVLLNSLTATGVLSNLDLLATIQSLPNRSPGVKCAASESRAA